MAAISPLSITTRGLVPFHPMGVASRGFYPFGFIWFYNGQFVTAAIYGGVNILDWVFI